MKKKILDASIFILLLLTLYYSIDYIKLVHKNNLIKKEIRNEISVLERNKKGTIKNLEYYKEYYKNDNIVGRLKIRNTSIDTLLVKGNDNEYYLNHSISNEYDEKGSIFIDYRTDLNSKQINIYGHNSNVYDVIFKELENYLDKNYFSNHKYIELWDGDKTKIYEIFSVQVVTSGYEHYTVNPSNLEAHIMNLNNSIYETGNVASTKDEILVIQTCLYNPANSLLLINAKKV